MPDLDIERIAKALAGGMDDPVITKKEEGKPKQQVDIKNLAAKHKSTDKLSSDSSKAEKKPSFMPKLSGDVDHTPPEETSKNSQIDTATAIATVGILKQELAKIDCQLSDYQIKFNLNGIDINNLKISADNLDELRKKVSNIPSDKRHKIASKVSSLAMRAIQSQLAERLKLELGLDVSAFEYEDIDRAAISASVAKEEDTTPDEIANMMDSDLDFDANELSTDEQDLDMGQEEPGIEDIEPDVDTQSVETPMPGVAPEPMPSGPPPAAPPAAPQTPQIPPA